MEARKMNEEQKRFFAIPFEKREDAFFEMFPDGKFLKEKLLSIGGSRVAWMVVEPHLSAIINNGQSFSTDKRKKIEGATNRCHGNTAKLFLQKDNIKIVTGYALSDEVWRQHSWGYDGKKIIETTCLFEAYHGVILSGLDITQFVFGELGDEIMQYPRDQIMKLPISENKVKFQ
jgi:hypothetical protein